MLEENWNATNVVLAPTRGHFAEIMPEGWFSFSLTVPPPHYLGSFSYTTKLQSKKLLFKGGIFVLSFRNFVVRAGQEQTVAKFPRNVDIYQ